MFSAYSQFAPLSCSSEDLSLWENLYRVSPVTVPSPASHECQGTMPLARKIRVRRVISFIRLNPSNIYPIETAIQFLC